MSVLTGLPFDWFKMIEARHDQASAEESLKRAVAATELVECDAQITQLRGTLDEEALRSAWAEGRELTADQAVAFALSG